MLLNILLRLMLIFQPVLAIPLVTPGLYFTFPESGSNVSGIVEIRGSIPVMNFSSAEVSYAYADVGATNWFLISKIDHAVQDDVLGNWDTTTITDGVYQLRLSVTLTNGEVNEVVIKDIQVTNYTHPNSTTLPALVTATADVFKPESTSVPGIHPTNIPSNPASTDSGQLKTSILAGILAAVLLLFLLVIYNTIRGLRKRR